MGPFYWPKSGPVAAVAATHQVCSYRFGWLTCDNGKLLFARDF